MENKLILSLDLGTQSARAILIDEKGNLIAKEQKKYSPAYNSPENGYCEQNPDFYFNYIVEVTKNVISNNKNLTKNICGVVLTSFRDTAVFLDKDLKVLRPSILWLDQRVSHYIPKLAWWKSLALNIIGMAPVVKQQQQKTMAHWVKENQPDIWNKVYKYVNISTYLNYKITGQLTDTIANIIGHYPVDYKHAMWYGKFELKNGIFDIPKSTYCSLVKPTEIIGLVNKEFEFLTGLPAGLPLYGTGSDKSCESLGNGCIDETFASISYGTASSVTITTKKYIEPSPFLPAYTAVQRGYYNSELQIYRGYWMLNWFKDEFCNQESLEANIQNLATLDILNKKMLDIGPGSDGLVLQPYWGPSLERPNSRGSIIGFSEKHTKIHLYRAIIEGIAFCLREGKEHIEKKIHKKITKIVVSGGGSVSKAICQITADIFGLPVYKTHTIEASCLGAAMSGFIACNVYSNEKEAKENMVRYVEEFIPNKENHEKYNFLFKKVYTKIYPDIKKLTYLLREFTGEKL